MPSFVVFGEMRQDISCEKNLLYIRYVHIFLSLVKQRMHDNFIQNWNSRLIESSRASFYSGICSFHYQHYLNCVRVESIDRQ